jgi:hypothetical protein
MIQTQNSDSRVYAFPLLHAISSKPVIKQNNMLFINEKISCTKVTRKLALDGRPNMQQILFLETAFGTKGLKSRQFQ